MKLIDSTFFKLEEIYEYEFVDELHNMVDIMVEEDESFTLFNGIVSHNSAVTPLMSARDPKLHGVYPLGGKPLNVREKKPVDLMKSEKFTNILSILGLKIGVEPILPDGKWLVYEIDGKEYLVNENDLILD